MSVLSLSYYESHDRIRNTSQSLTYNMAENSWHRYDMKKLRHCHPMYMHFRGLLPLTEFCQVQNSLYVQVLRSPIGYIGSLTARHSSSGRQSNFAAWYKEWNYGTFPEGATYIRFTVYTNCVGLRTGFVDLNEGNSITTDVPVAPMSPEAPIAPVRPLGPLSSIFSRPTGPGGPVNPAGPLTPVIP